MKLVIDISEEDFKFIKGLRLILGGRGNARELQRDVINAIRNGTPLPNADRKFIEIRATYTPDELVAYPEYKGKPYYSIVYEENGELFCGFGTYKIEVLSEYLRDYFIISETGGRE